LEVEPLNPARTFACLAAAGTVALLGVTNALADNAVVVTPASTHGWSTADTRPGGAVSFVSDPSSPYPSGALQLTTDLTTTAKAQYLHAANTRLAKVKKASFWTKQVSGPAFADPSYQVVTCLGGGVGTSCVGFTTLVFEPYQNPQEGAIVPGAWQKWNTAAGLYWSTRSFTCSNGAVAGTPGGPATYTLAAIATLCPSANVEGYGVNIGSNNPGYVVRTDGFQFNSRVYDFQLSNDEGDGSDSQNGDGSDSQSGDNQN
jgi:hypothetical protein